MPRRANLWARDGLYVDAELTADGDLVINGQDLRGAAGASAESLEDLVDIALTECERFFPAFQFVLWGGKSPADALAAAMLDCVGEA